MQKSNKIFDLWDSATTLGYAWWVFADEENKRKFHELQKTGDHQAQQRYMEIDVNIRLYLGNLKAIGIETGSSEGPVFIPQYYFSKTAQIDLNKDTICALGKEFREIRVIGISEPQSEPENAPAMDQAGPAEIPKQRPKIGRPPVLEELRIVVRELNAANEFDGLTAKAIENLIRARAKQKFPRLFSAGERPSRNKINEALRAEGPLPRASE